MIAQHRHAYSRIETDAELTARVRVRFPGSCRWSNEDVDQYAERLGFERKIVWVDG